MNKYFNNDILNSLVSQVPVDKQDLANDRFVAMEPVARYVVYISSDPCKELHPRNVKKNLRDLFGKEATSHGCVVRIREEKLSVLKLNIPKVAEPKSLDNVNETLKGGFAVNPKATPSTSIINQDERARGGLNITFDPKVILEMKSRSNRAKNMLEEPTKGQVEPKEPSFMTSQMSIQETSSESSQEDDLADFQLTKEALMDYLKDQWNQYRRLNEASSCLDWLRNSDCDIIQWLCIISVTSPTQPSHFEKIKNGLDYCLRVVDQFFSAKEEPADNPIRPYMDHEHYAAIVLGPTIDEFIALLADRFMIAINRPMHRYVAAPDTSELNTKTEQ